MNGSLNPSAFIPPRRTPPNVDTLLERLVGGDRQALATAITLAESRLPEHRRTVEDLLRRLDSATARSIRYGITGLPGAGKSTFIEALGIRLLQRGHRVAVLAIDPSSTLHEGSILADKTRMPTLTSHPDAYIRPSPSSGLLGGIAAATHEAVLLCEAAGFDRILVETVGVGQSETTVERVTDLLLLLLIPGAGDELQGLKGGILELADIVLVNKADGEGLHAAKRTLSEYKAAFHYRAGRSSPSGAGAGGRGGAGAADPSAEDETGERLAMVCSAVTGFGLDEMPALLDGLIAQRERSGQFTARRERQAGQLLDAQIRRRLEFDFFTDPAVQHALQEARNDLREGREDLFTLADRLVRTFKER